MKFPKIVRIFCFFIFFGTSIHAQTLKGYIQNTKGECIPYANIVFSNKDIGTCSNQQGYFELNIENNPNDTIKISAIGYETIWIFAKTLERDLNRIITMQEAIYALPSVAISPKKTVQNNYKLGFFKSRKKTRGSVCGLVGMQYAVYIKNTIDKTGILQMVFMRLSSGPPDMDWVNIRLRIYACAKDGLPGHDLLKENLIIKPKKGNNRIDVSRYNIYFPPEGVWVAMEYIDAENRKYKEKTSVNPCLQCTFARSDSLTYYSYRNRKWQHGDHLRLDQTNPSNGLIGIEIMAE